jgi:hypothetical protein
MNFEITFWASTNWRTKVVCGDGVQSAFHQRLSYIQSRQATFPLSEDPQAKGKVKFTRA